MKRPRSGGGIRAIAYSFKVASRVGWWNMWKAMRTKNSCKTCAVGMGGQLGGMVNEGGHFPEVCKKSFQAMASDMQGAIPDSFWQNTSVAQMKAMSSLQLEHCGRLAKPVLLRRGETHFRPIDWDEALSISASAMKDAGPERSFFYASGRASNEAGFLLQLMARQHGTNYVNNCSYYCHQASGVGLGSSIGSGAGTIRLEDLEHVDLYILIGANPPSNHPRLMTSLMKLRRRGGKVIVVNPVRELGLVNFRIPSNPISLLMGTEIASTYIQPHIGGDMYWLLGLAKEVIEQGGHDSDFLKAHTEGFEEFRQLAESTSWDEIQQRSGVERSAIQDIAHQYLKAKNVVFAWCMGITHHLHGTSNVQMIANAALLRGMVGRRHAGVMPIRGHSNVQGLGSVGVKPALKTAMLQKLEERLGIKVPQSPGYDTMACMEAAAKGEMDFSLLLGGNLYGSNPDLQFAANAFERMKCVTYLSTTLNTGHAWGTGETTLILPVQARDEESQATTQESMFSFVRLSDGGNARFPGPRSEVSVLSELATRTLGSDSPVDFSSLQEHRKIRELIGELVPGYEDMLGIDETKEEFHVRGRALSDYQFPTDSGKARFHCPSLPQHEFGEEEFRLMTVRSEGQFNSVVYEEQDLYRGQERRDVILMSSADMKRLKLEPNQHVRISSGSGELRRILVREYDIRAGNVLMYYPEANVLVPRAVDPQSKTPGFKGVKVTIRAEQLQEATAV